MNILIVEDNPLHQEAARILLAEHELTIATSFKEGADLLAAKIEENVERLLRESGFAQNPQHDRDYWKLPQAEQTAVWNKYLAAVGEARKQSVTPAFDAVLTDVHMPSRVTIPGVGGERSAEGEVEGAIGFVLALMALKVGVKMVGIITDANHHCDPVSHALDRPGDGVIAVGDARIAVIHDGRHVMTEIGGENENGMARRGKDWALLLRGLTEGSFWK